MQFLNNRSRRSPKIAGARACTSQYGMMVRNVNVLLVFLLVPMLVFAARAQASDAKTILALGDSLTAGYGLAQSDAFPVQLQAALVELGVNAQVVNAGVSGDTSAGGRSRLQWLLSNPVDAVIVELGANDGLRGLDPTQTRNNLDWIMATLKKNQIPTLITGMYAPPNLGEDYGAEFNAIYPDLAKKYGALYDRFYLEGVAADPALNQADGIHPNADGVALIVKRLAPRVQELLQHTK